MLLNRLKTGGDLPLKSERPVPRGIRKTVCFLLFIICWAVLTMAEGGETRKQPQRGPKVNYKAMHEGNLGMSDEEAAFGNELKNPLRFDTFGSPVLGDAWQGRRSDAGDEEEDERARIREEFQSLEREERELRRQRTLNEDRRRLERKREEVKQLRGEVFNPCSEMDKRKFDISLQDLRKNAKLSGKVRTQMKGLGLGMFESAISSSESGDSNSFPVKNSSKSKSKKGPKSVKKETDFSGPNSDSSDDRVCLKQSHVRKNKKGRKNLKKGSVDSLSDPDSSSSSDSGSQKTKKSKKRKSGISAKAADSVENPQRYPHSQLRFEFVHDAVSFDKLDMNLFIAGELEIITSSKTSRAERSGRLDLLKRLMYLNSAYEFSVIRSLYSAVLREVELGNLKWGESFLYVEQSVLNSSKKFNKRGKGQTGKTENEDKVWFCSQYQRNKCNLKSPHTLVVKGTMRLAHHICASCWLKDKVKLEHPECSSACPHAKN